MRFDTIVVGSGSAGAVLAARISEDGTRSVLLVEAGPDPGPELPADLVDGRQNSLLKHDWGFRHRATTARRVRFLFPRGRVVGGSSAVNTCIALRPLPADLDEWAARGLSDWAWPECLPALKRLENDLDYEDEWHSQEGPLPLRRHPESEWTPWQAAFVDACLSQGVSACRDTNNPELSGVGPHAMNKIDGRRINAASVYLTSKVRARDNLTLMSDTLARRVLFERNKAIGVEVERRGVVEEILANRIVLAAGAINTPGILLRSGVGRVAEMERLGIERTVANEAIAERLLDHPGTAIFFRPKKGVCDRSDPLIQTVWRYRSPGEDCPNDMQIQPGSKVPLPWLSLRLVSLMCAVGKPRGHGRIRWLSADPNAKPQIESRLLEDPVDRARAVDAMRRAFSLSQEPGMASLAKPFWPNTKVLRDDAKADAWIRRACDSGYHPAGTVPMGADDDPRAATDGRGRVRGCERLYVADASLMPTMVSANTNLTTIMIGEKIGAWLRDG